MILVKTINSSQKAYLIYCWRWGQMDNKLIQNFEALSLFILFMCYNILTKGKFYLSLEVLYLQNLNCRMFENQSQSLNINDEIDFQWFYGLENGGYNISKLMCRVVEISFSMSLDSICYCFWKNTSNLQSVFEEKSRHLVKFRIHF